MNFLKNNIKDLSILFLSLLILFVAIWIINTFGDNVYYVEILYNIHIGYEGFKNSPNSYKIEFIVNAILPAIFLSIVILIISKKIKNILNFTQTNEKYLWLNKYKYFFKILFFNKYLKILLFNYNILLIYSVLFFLLKFGFFEYFEKNARYEDYPNLYNNPYLIKYNEPTNQKNLILFYVESLEYDVAKLSNEIKPNPIQAIDDIKGENVYNFKHAPSTGFSIAGVVASQCSLPFNVVINMNLNRIPKEKLFCFSDVLAEQNYEQIFYISVDKQFQSFGAFKERHGYKVHDVNIINKDSKLTERPTDDSAWGKGVYDSALLNHAKNEIIKKHKEGKKFNFTLINTDTHHPFGFSPECLTDDISTETLQAYEAYKCSSSLIKKFFDDLENEGALDNTVVIILGDHLAYRDIIGALNKRNKRNIYFKINSKKKIERSKMNHFDVAPTILDALDILPNDNKQFGFGVSLFQDKNEFNYDQHYDLVMRSDIISNFYIRRLLKFVPVLGSGGVLPPEPEGQTKFGLQF